MKQMRLSKAVLKAITLSSMLALGGTYASATEHPNPDPSEATTSLQGNLNLSEDGGYDPNPPSDLNEKTEINNSYFGISYVPENFNFGTSALLDGVQKQQINAERGDKTYHVGVKDKRRENTQTWTLNVKHSISVDNGYQGVTLTIPTSGEVKRNMNDGSQDFQSSDLISQVQKNSTNEVQKISDINVTTEEKTIMHTTGGQFVNGVYDLNLGEVTLNIPDASKVAAQELSGSVEWTLSNTPMKQSYLTEEIRNLFKDGNCTTLKTNIRCQDVEAAKESIKTVRDQRQKDYNQEYFNKYVAPCFVEWDLLGNRNSGEDIYLGNAKYFKLADNSRAGIFFNKTSKTKPHDGPGWAKEDYLHFVVRRGNSTILDHGIKTTDQSIWSESVEVQPGDIIEIFHKEGTGHRLKAYPTDYKPTRPYEAEELTLRFKVDKDLSLKTFERN
jgi:hypothetical protein